MAADSSSHREMILSALNAAFGSRQVDAITPIQGGASGAFPYRIRIGDRSYVVRMEGDGSSLRNPHQYKSMQISADAGIAPMIYHIDEATRVVVMDFIEEKPLVDFPGGSIALVQGLGQLIRRIQATKPFPPFLDYPEMVQRLWQWVCRTGLFAPGILEPYTKRLTRIRESYDCNSAQLRSSHNDIVPRNVLFDGKRLWLIDWESAYRNHLLVDVAIALDCFGKTPELESLLLQAWLGHKPDDALYAMLTPVRALARLYYAGVFLSASFAALGALGDSDLDAPSISEFDRSIREGTLAAGTPETKHILGKMYLRSFLTDVAAPGVEAAV